VVGDCETTAGDGSPQNDTITRRDDTDISCDLTRELLCFLQQRSKVMKFDDLVQISGDFYTPVEIRKAQTLMSQFVLQRLPG